MARAVVLVFRLASAPVSVRVAEQVSPWGTSLWFRAKAKSGY